MFSSSVLPSVTAPANLCELFLCDLALLLVECRLVEQTLPTFRPQCEFSPELTASLDHVVAVSAAGESHLLKPLADAGAVLPAAGGTFVAPLVAGFFSWLPAAVPPGVVDAEVSAHLRVIAHHLELKVRLAAEAALLVGQQYLGQALVAWRAQWRACERALRPATVRARARAYVADLGGDPSPAMA